MVQKKLEQTQRTVSSFTVGLEVFTCFQKYFLKSVDLFFSLKSILENMLSHFPAESYMKILPFSCLSVTKYEATA